MAALRPFSAVRFTHAAGDLSMLVAPPYDVLDEAGREALLEQSRHNIVKVDLPYLPPKSVGPDAVYTQAADTLKDWTADGFLSADSQTSFYAYSQRFTRNGREYDRRGLYVTVRLEEFSTPQTPTHIVPHEKTYASAIEDRLKLTRATQAQLSPIFGLYSDNTGDVAKAVANVSSERNGEPDAEAVMDGVTNRLWQICDGDTITAVVDLMKYRPIYIADGHHRYTMALAYKRELEAQNGGPLADDHPANFCLFVLVSMQDPGCIILPTHRIVGGLRGFDIARLKNKLAHRMTVEEVDVDEDNLADLEADIAAEPNTAFGLLDGNSRKSYVLRLIDPDPLQSLEPGQSAEWRNLDVSILRRYLLDDVIGPEFAQGEPKLAYTADAKEVSAMTDGEKFQIAIIVRPTPLQGLIDLGRHGEVMPQKSTYFYPKLATGMLINPLNPQT